MSVVRSEAQSEEAVPQAVAAVAALAEAVKKTFTNLDRPRH